MPKLTLQAIEKSDFVRRLERVAELYDRRARGGPEFAKLNLPIALHGWPKCGLENFCGVGPVEWGKSAESLFDVRVGPVENGSYHTINKRLAAACAELGLPYFNMA